MNKIDLHIHSVLSDGNLNIDEIIDLSKKSNCNKIAITDHERIEDYSMFNKDGIEIINGIEFNSSGKRMHFLGYGIKDIKKMSSFLDGILTENEYICYELIRRLKIAKFDISYTQIREYIESIGLNCNFLDKRKIVKYLIHKGYYEKVKEVYDKLIGQEADFYIPNKKLTPAKIIKLIDDCGGVSVLAHPATLELNEKDFLYQMKELIEYGLDGIEIINRKMDKSKIALYNSVAEKNNLIKTVGSDFHNPIDNTIGIEVEENLFDTLKEKIKCKNLKKI